MSFIKIILNRNIHSWYNCQNIAFIYLF